MIKETPYNFQIPAITASVCSNNSWVATPAAPEARSNHTTVCTGTEMVIYEGYNGETVLEAGSKYNPSTDTWTDISTTNSLGPIENHSAVWTGTEMIIWRGYNETSGCLNTGSKYNPASDTLNPISNVNAPSLRAVHSAIWTDNEMII